MQNITNKYKRENNKKLVEFAHSVITIINSLYTTEAVNNPARCCKKNWLEMIIQP